MRQNEREHLNEHGRLLVHKRERPVAQLCAERERRGRERRAVDRRVHRALVRRELLRPVSAVEQPRGVRRRWKLLHRRALRQVALREAREDCFALVRDVQTVGVPERLQGVFGGFLVFLVVLF